jgi:hypothetical protein
MIKSVVYFAIKQLINILLDINRKKRLGFLSVANERHNRSPKHPDPGSPNPLKLIDPWARQMAYDR